MNNILITGAAGFIGFHLAQSFLDKPENRIIALDNLDDYYSEGKEEHLRILGQNNRCAIVKLDILDQDALDGLFKEYLPSTVIHLAARPGVRSSFGTAMLHQSINVDGTNVIIQLVEKYKVKKFIFASSSSVYGERAMSKGPVLETDTPQPVSPYAQTKLQAEKNINEALSQSETVTTIMRLFSVYGEYMRPDLGLSLFVEAMLRGQPIRKFGDGQSMRDYTYIDDVIGAIGLLLQREQPGVEIFNVASSHPVSLNDTIDIAVAKLKRQAVIEHLGSQAGDVTCTWGSIDKIKALGFTPKVQFADGVGRFIDWFEARNR